MLGEPILETHPSDARVMEIPYCVASAEMVVTTFSPPFRSLIARGMSATVRPGGAALTNPVPVREGKIRIESDSPAFDGLRRADESVLDVDVSTTAALGTEATPAERQTGEIDSESTADDSDVVGDRHGRDPTRVGQRSNGVRVVRDHVRVDRDHVGVDQTCFGVQNGAPATHEDDVAVGGVDPRNERNGVAHGRRPRASRPGS